MKQTTFKKALTSVTLSLALCAASLPNLAVQASSTTSSYPYTYFSDVELDYEIEVDNGYIDEGNSSVCYTSDGEIWGLDVMCRHLDHSCIDFTMPTTVDGTAITEFTAEDWGNVYFSGYDYPEYSISQLNIYFPENYDKVELDGIYYAAEAIIDSGHSSSVEIHVYVENPDAVITSSNNWAYSEIVNYIDKITYFLHTDKQLYIDNPFYITNRVIPITETTLEPTPAPTPTPTPTPVMYPNMYFTDVEMDYEIEVDNGYIDEGNSSVYYSSNGEIWGLDVMCRHLDHSCIDFTMPTTIDGTAITEFTADKWNDVYFSSYDYPEYSISQLNIYFPENYDKVELDGIYYAAEAIIDSGHSRSVEIHVYVENPNAVITSSNNWAYSEIVNYVDKITYFLHTDKQLYIDNPFYITNRVVPISE